MRCSECQGHSLKPEELEEGLVSAACPYCKGVLLSLTNYRFWIDRYSERMLPVDEDADAEVMIKDSEAARSCPKCSRLMTKYQVCASSDNRVDLCSGCDEVWLDKGEWHLLKRLDVASKLTSVFTDAWQRRIRTDHERESLKARYEKLLGSEDFSQVDSFKRWLDQHPEIHAIKNYLNSSTE